MSCFRTPLSFFCNVFWGLPLFAEQRPQIPSHPPSHILWWYREQSGTRTAGICCIKVLGAGCKSCHALQESTKEAVKNLDLSLEVEYITDMEKIMAYGVMRMPALVVSEEVVSMGRVLKTAEAENLLKG